MYYFNLNYTALISKGRAKAFTLFLLVVCYSLNSFGQVIPEIKIPQPATMTPNVVVGNTPGYTNPTPNVPNVPNYITRGKTRQQINMEIIENDMKMVQARETAMRDMYNDIENQRIANYNHQQGLRKYISSNYWNAYNKLKDMLEGKIPMNLKQAVYEVEHAFNNTFTYEQFNQAIQYYVQIVKLKMAQDGNSMNNNIALNLTISKVLSDTVTLDLPQRETDFTSYPVTYDFDDYWGKDDWNKMFVSKLLATRTGQCHSMPLLYLIVAEELKAEAYLSFSPNHSYIKFKDNRTMYNFETTQGVLVTDQWVMGSGYISTEAVKNGVFMDTLNKKQTVAHCVNDLASGYIKMFGYGDTTFVNACADLSLEHYNKGNAVAHVLKSNNYYVNLKMLEKKYGVDNYEKILHIPEVKDYWEKHDKEFQFIEATGYKNIPKDKYDTWLKSAKEYQEWSNRKIEQQLIPFLK